MYNNTADTYNICTEILQKYYKILQNTMEVLRLYYSGTTVLRHCRLQVTTGHYCHYCHYRFRGNVTWFADERSPDLLKSISLVNL